VLDENQEGVNIKPASILFSIMQEDALEALIAANANKGATAMDDMNALHFAAQSGHTEISRMLIKNGDLHALAWLPSQLGCTNSSVPVGCHRCPCRCFGFIQDPKGPDGIAYRRRKR